MSLAAHDAVIVYPNPEAVALEAARRFVETFTNCNAPRFSLALSGGSTPQRFYRLLGESPWREQIDWSRVHVFLADERCVALDHADSNYRMIGETLLDQVPIPAANRFPVPVLETPEACAAAYDAQLREFFGAEPARFDCIVLGMGPDGHTASLFPGREWHSTDWVLAVRDSPKPPPFRVSLSLDLINAAQSLMFLVTGADKALAVADIFQEGGSSLPAAQVRPSQGNLLWLLDQAAAGEV
jgi:6-phosphogluconolactonase